ncbi:MAG: assimilatory sulfite reductase (NADPH) flavoprotein subunit [Phycisphaerae bacterium]|nr:assimilatory sulfite reductase (NADPH) flavoprotein subunit [Saprospiraceae bacterium]
MSNILSAPPPPVGFDTDLLKKLVTQHSALQQMWLSGYLYGVALHGQSAPNDLQALLSESSFAAPALNGNSKPKITVLFGSQTGNSKKVANQVATSVREHGWEVTVADLNDYPTKQLKDEKVVLLVISTQGEGEPPVAAEEFHKWLMGARAPKLEGLKFAVCGLGDRSYLQFCQTGKEFDARFEALGATRIAERVDCDVDFEEAVEEWIGKVLENLPVPAALAAGGTQVGISNTNGHYAAAHPAAKAAGTGTFDRKHPFAAPILEKIQLNGRGSQKETWHLELSLEGSGLAYEPGDSLGIYPQNPPSLVREVLYAAMLNGNKTVIFNEKENTLRHFLLREVELSVLTRELIEKYATWSNNAKLKALLEDNAALKQFLWGRNVADLIREFPAAMSEATLLSFLRKMPPRLYSIASSLEAHPDEVHLTVAAVRYEYGGRPHLGTASTFLADRVAAGESMPVFIERNEYFKLPTDDSTDIIMVGPGTGVAPFRAFVEERSESRGGTSRQQGKNWLFFGNPHFETDFLYQTEWLNHLKRGTLDRLDVAFSRDQADKIYVQHRLAERSKLIYERLENGAHFYVCGDKERMASDVQNAVLQIVAKESGKGEEYATEYLKGLKKQRRYLEDVY